jgi:hypothetical protein
VLGFWCRGFVSQLDVRLRKGTFLLKGVNEPSSTEGVIPQYVSVSILTVTYL